MRSFLGQTAPTDDYISLERRAVLQREAPIEPTGARWPWIIAAGVAVYALWPTKRKKSRRLSGLG